jgi:hypothetical protein
VNRFSNQFTARIFSLAWDVRRAFSTLFAAEHSIICTSAVNDAADDGVIGRSSYFSNLAQPEVAFDSEAKRKRSSAQDAAKAER